MTGSVVRGFLFRESVRADSNSTKGTPGGKWKVPHHICTELERFLSWNQHPCPAATLFCKAQAVLLKAIPTPRHWLLPRWETTSLSSTFTRDHPGARRGTSCSSRRSSLQRGPRGTSPRAGLRCSKAAPPRFHPKARISLHAPEHPSLPKAGTDPPAARRVTFVLAPNSLLGVLHKEPEISSPTLSRCS